MMRLILGILIFVVSPSWASVPIQTLQKVFPSGQYSHLKVSTFSKNCPEPGTFRWLNQGEGRWTWELSIHSALVVDRERLSGKSVRVDGSKFSPCKIYKKYKWQAREKTLTVLETQHCRHKNKSKVYRHSFKRVRNSLVIHRREVTGKSEKTIMKCHYSKGPS